MNRLLEIGFEPAGQWLLDSDVLRLELNRHSTQRNVLYAFVCDGEVKYVGKTIKPLAVRMAGYRNPAKGQRTNVRNNKLIRQHLARGDAVEILALPDSGLMHYGRFHLNLAAALEDSIVRIIAPSWNGGKLEDIRTDELRQVVQAPTPQKAEGARSSVAHAAAIADPPSFEANQTFLRTFDVVLRATYWKKGFFNVGVSSEKYIGSDGETIEILIPELGRPILGTINRRCNKNGTPRVMGGTGLRDWFQEFGKTMDIVEVQALSSTSIRLRFHGPVANCP